MSNSHSFSKDKKLKSKKLIEAMFEHGASINAYPYKLFYYYNPIIDDPFKVAVSVSKRNFKQAVDRNRIKRLMREAFRKQQESLQPILSREKGALTMMLVYIDRQMPDYNGIYETTEKALIKLNRKLSS